MLKLWLVLGLTAVTSATIRLQERYSWNVLDWEYPDEYSRQQAIVSGALIPENALPVGVERWRNKLFVTVPRWRPGNIFFYIVYTQNNIITRKVDIIIMINNYMSINYQM